MDMNASVVIITGADSGIGRATAIRFATVGFDVGITWHSDADGARETAEAVRARGRRAAVQQLDLGRGEDAANVVRALAAELGSLDVFVNNAAVNHREPALTEEPDAWRRVLETNLTGPFLCAQAAAAIMVAQGRGGRIVNVTSVHERVPLQGGAAYAASKAGMGLVTKVMALELAEHEITVNSVAPGHIATPMNGYGPDDPERTGLPGVPAGRTGRPREVASTISYLASPDARFVTGACYAVDGGLELMAVAELQAAVES